MLHWFEKRNHQFRRQLRDFEGSVGYFWGDGEKRWHELLRFSIELRCQIRRCQYVAEGKPFFELPQSALSRIWRKKVDYGPEIRPACGYRVKRFLENKDLEDPLSTEEVFQDMSTHLGWMYNCQSEYIDDDPWPEEFDFARTGYSEELTLDHDLFLKLVHETMIIRFRPESSLLNYVWRAYIRPTDGYRLPIQNVVLRAAKQAQAEGETDCMICLQPFGQEAEHPVRTKCGHIMGSECIKTWVQTPGHNHGRCPKCRNELFESVLDKIPKHMVKSTMQLVENRRRIMALDEEVNRFLLMGKLKTYDPKMGQILHELNDIVEVHKAVREKIMQQWDRYYKKYISKKPIKHNIQFTLEKWEDELGDELDMDDDEWNQHFEQVPSDEEEEDDSDDSDEEMPDAFAEPETESEDGMSEEDGYWEPGETDDEDAEYVPTRLSFSTPDMLP